MRTPLIAGNWKMYKTVAEAVELVEALMTDLPEMADREVLICPPFTALYPLSPLLSESPIQLGAQNMYGAGQGAFTGEVSPVMLAELNCRYVILGHSERRQLFGEDDALINAKVRSALEHGLKPILCIGETKQERDASKAEEITLGQLRAGLGGLAAEQLNDVVIAYEPVWAIGTGRTPSEADIGAVHAHIREELEARFGAAGRAVRILYGGSMKPANAAVILAVPEVNGGLIGGASLKAGDFLAIIRAAAGA